MSEDEHVAELVFRVRDSTELCGLPMVVAELDPAVEDVAAGFAGPESGGLVGGLQSSAEISLEETLDGKWSSTQGSACG